MRVCVYVSSPAMFHDVAQAKAPPTMRTALRLPRPDGKGLPYDVVDVATPPPLFFLRATSRNAPERQRGKPLGARHRPSESGSDDVSAKIN